MTESLQVHQRSPSLVSSLVFIVSAYIIDKAAFIFQPTAFSHLRGVRVDKYMEEVYDKIPNMKEIVDKISHVFNKFPEVLFGYLFGSIVEGTEGPLSDIDIAVYMKPYSHEAYIRLHTEIARALKRSDIDLIVLNRTKNLILLEEIIRKGKLLFDRNPSLRMEYEAMTLHRAIDFRTHRKAIMGV